MNIILPVNKYNKINVTKLISKLRGLDICDIKNILNNLYYKEKKISYNTYWCVNLCFGEYIETEEII